MLSGILGIAAGMTEIAVRTKPRQYGSPPNDPNVLRQRDGLNPEIDFELNVTYSFVVSDLYKFLQTIKVGI